MADGDRLGITRSDGAAMIDLRRLVPICGLRTEPRQLNNPPQLPDPERVRASAAP